MPIRHELIWWYENIVERPPRVAEVLDLIGPAFVGARGPGAIRDERRMHRIDLFGSGRFHHAPGLRDTLCNTPVVIRLEAVLDQRVSVTADAHATAAPVARQNRDEADVPEARHPVAVVIGGQPRHDHCARAGMDGNGFEDRTIATVPVAELRAVARLECPLPDVNVIVEHAHRCGARVEVEIAPDLAPESGPKEKRGRFDRASGRDHGASVDGYPASSACDPRPPPHVRSEINTRRTSTPVTIRAPARCASWR